MVKGNKWKRDHLGSTAVAPFIMDETKNVHYLDAFSTFSTPTQVFDFSLDQL